MSDTSPEETATSERARLPSASLAPAAVLLAVVINMLWGTNPIALKIALRSLPPIGSAGIRFAVAAVGVWLWCRATGVPVAPRRGEVPWLAAVGVFFVLQISTFTLGVYWGTASHSTVLLNTYPFFVLALAHFLIPGDRATIGRAAAVAAAFSGVVVLFAGEWGSWEGTNLLGDIVQLTSAFILGSQVVFLKHAVARVHAERVVLWQMTIGAAAFLLYSLAFEDLAGARPSAESLSAVIYQGVMIGTVCFTVWTLLIRRYAASRVAVFGFISPLVGVALSALVLGEVLGPTLLISAVLVAAGIILANLW
ncbi:MAG: DMT family transporter [Armatimonadota bacterium]|nr:MAG: DMT family transporter [Armatimonadota bacterium]